MSWFRTAVSKAVEAGNKNNFTRNIKSAADTFVHHAGQAVAEGAKILQDHIVARNVRSVKQTIRRLEEAAVSCRGSERVLLLGRWLAALKEVEKFYEGSSEDKQMNLEEIIESEEAKENPTRPVLVLYYDEDVGGLPMSFREVFLQSQALEAITISMILEAPNDEEINLLLEMFRLCLSGGMEVHNAIVSSIQDLATVFSSYQDEVLVKREELLQFAQSAITGLKINADIIRMDVEASNLKKKLDGIGSLQKLPNEGQENAPESTLTVEALKEALAQIRICSRLEGILLKKKLLNNGDSPEVHAQKVDKLKVLSESLANSSSKSEKRVSEQRLQKEEALKVRMTKATEADEREKEIAAEISELEKQRDELEAELKKVNISLAAANARLRNAREERDQFDEANNQIVAHLKTKEDELSKSIIASRAEAEVLSTWINFLEDTWVLQCSYAETRNKQVRYRHEDYFVNLALSLLFAYKEELGPSIIHIEKFVENLKKLSERSEMTPIVGNEDSKELNPRKHLEEEYLENEAKIITTFSVVDNMKELFYSQHGASSRKDDARIKELFDEIEKLRGKFESIERPNLEIEAPLPEAYSPSSQKAPASPSAAPKLPTTLKSDREANTENPAAEAELVLDHEVEIAKLESEFGNSGRDYSTEEIGGWEFDELERELTAGE
ncbi:hypothetical protein SLEP1_g5644 [Rubroshorea leprosula]|uniref:Uncharacterized protein n=1 Tax=Rubroshorea leprosula TaxID=152421 RepID=A0AAV5I271_9ROSI|nr:hypothetical protein SLEP1_g5644 [Rubroshorea leprosula]